MEGKPNAEDARLVMELWKLGDTERGQKASKWFWTEFLPKKLTDYVEFRRLYPMGSEGSDHIGQITSWWELAGALVEHGVINEDLFFDTVSPPKMTWEPLKFVIYGLRGEMNEPRIMENFELLYERSKRWQKANPPKIQLATA